MRRFSNQFFAASRLSGAMVLLLGWALLPSAPAAAQADPLIEEIENPRRADADEPGDKVKKKRPAGGTADEDVPSRRKKRRPKKGVSKGAAPTGDESADVDDVPPSASDVDITARTYEGLLERWRHLRVASEAGDAAAARLAASEFDDGALALGVTGQRYGAQAFRLAEAAARRAQLRLERGDPEGALESANRAVALAPSLAGPRWVRARIHRETSGGILSAAGDMVSALWAQSQHYEGQVHLAAVTSSVFVLAWVLMLWVLALVYLLSSLRLMAYDLFTLFPKGAAPWQLMVVTALLALVPLLAGLGPVFVPLTWLAASFIYLSARSRKVVGLVLLFSVVMPIATEAAAHFWAYPLAPIHDEFAARVDAEQEGLRSALLDAPVTSLSAVELAAAADGAFRAGDFNTAKTLLQAVIRRDPTAHWAQNDIAAIAAITGKADLATAELDKLLQDAPTLAEAVFNRTQMALKRPGGAGVAPAANDAAGPAERERFRRITFRADQAKTAYNRLFVRVAPPMLFLQKAYEAPAANAGALAQRFFDALFIGFGRDLATGFIGAFLFLCFVLELISRRFEPSAGCVRCGAPCSARYDKDEVPRGTCSSCFHAFHRPGDVDARTRLAKERQVRRHGRIRISRARLAALLLPGSGYLLLQAPVRGGLLLTLFCLLATGALLGSLPLQGPTLFADGLLLVVALPLATVVVVGYLLSIRSLFLWTD